MNFIRKTLSTRLLDLMGERGVRQKGAHEITGVAQKTISNITTEASAATIDTLEALAKGFKVPTWTLLVRDVSSSKEAREIDHLVRLYLDCNIIGREQIIRTAEAESRYSSER